MRLIKFKLSALITSLCSTLLTLLGFGCSSDPESEPEQDPYSYLCMYGSPTGVFELKGAVTDEDGNNVEDAEIRVTYPDYPSGLYSLKKTTTDSEGQYFTRDSEYYKQLKVVCVPSDPELEADSVIVKLNYILTDENGEKGTWYQGEAKEIVNFRLKPKVSEEE